MTVEAAELALIADQGATFTRTITYETGATFETTAPVDLTGWTARMQIRRTPSGPDLLLSLTQAAGLTLGGTAGTVAITITAAQTAALPTGEQVYALDLIDGAGRVYKLLRGRLTVRPGITA